MYNKNRIDLVCDMIVMIGGMKVLLLFWELQSVESSDDLELIGSIGQTMNSGQPSKSFCYDVVPDPRACNRYE